MMLPPLQVCILKNQATEAQQKTVLAFNDYHLMIDPRGSEHRIGFYKTGYYATAPINKKGSLFRLIDENPELFEDGASKERLVVTCVEQEIKKADGLIRPIGHALQQWKVTGARKGPDVSAVIVQEELSRLLHHVAYGEEEEAEKILKWWTEELFLSGESLLSKFTGSVTDCSRARIFLNVGAFQLALRNGDWHMYCMMLKYIPEADQTAFSREQLQLFEKEKPAYRLDNLYFCGFRVLESDPTPEQQEDAIKHNAYHLILERDPRDRHIASCSIGFRDAECGEYRRRSVDRMSALGQFVLDPNNASLFQPKRGYPNLILRNKSLLDLAREKIEENGQGKTQEDKKSSLEDDIALLQEALTTYINKYTANAPPAELIEAWCVFVGRAQRLLPPNAWQKWIGLPFDDWLKISDEDFQGHSRCGAPITSSGASWFPLSSSFGCDYAVSVGGWGSLAADLATADLVRSFLNSFLSSSVRELSELKQQLSDHESSAMTPASSP